MHRGFVVFLNIVQQLLLALFSGKFFITPWLYFTSRHWCFPSSLNNDTTGCFYTTQENEGLERVFSYASRRENPLLSSISGAQTHKTVQEFEAPKKERPEMCSCRILFFFLFLFCTQKEPHCCNNHAKNLFSTLRFFAHTYWKKILMNFCWKINCHNWLKYTLQCLTHFLMKFSPRALSSSID